MLMCHSTMRKCEVWGTRLLPQVPLVPFALTARQLLSFLGLNFIGLPSPAQGTHSAPRPTPEPSRGDGINGWVRDRP